VKSGAIESGSFFSPTPSSIKYQVSIWKQAEGERMWMVN